MRLQGMTPETFKVVVSDAQLGKQIGNAMSVNVLERLFVRALPAAGLAEARTLADRWAGEAPAAVALAGTGKRRLLQPRAAAAAARGEKRRRRAQA
mmetsp:Transcript_35379/g.82169  ORF Transcript_35379/g.82169 Transcript_35379/m.82169 type:complete len:96 (+) Transcript_35379:2-289(+)